MLIKRMEVTGSVDLDVWPFTVPAIRQVAQLGVSVTSPILILVGANGSGKSTLIEAVAESYGIDVRGGHGGRHYGSPLPKSELGEVLRLSRTTPGRAFIGRNAKGFFLRAETAAGMLEYMTHVNVQGYGDVLSGAVSHGESYLQAIIGRFEPPGLFLLDEAEGPLSFESTLGLLYRLADLSTLPDTQVIYATHSPLIAALPGAQILELTDAGIEERVWRDLQSVRLWRRFLDRPESFFK